MGGSGGGNDKPKFPAEIKKMWGIGHPLATRMAASGMEGYPLWDVPAMPDVPPPVMPSAGWFQGIAPEVRQGLWEPYQEAGQQLGETFGSRGQQGSARGGYSGAYGSAMGSFAADAAKDVGLQAWQMTAPQMMDYRNQLYEGAMRERGDYLQAQQAPWTLFPSYLGGVGQLPYYATPNRPSPWVGAAGGAATGAAMGYGMGAGAGGAAAGAGIGGILGYMGYS